MYLISLILTITSLLAVVPQPFASVKPLSKRIVSMRLEQFPGAVRPMGVFDPLGFSRF